AISGTLSWARRLGRSVRDARLRHADPLEAILAETAGRRLFLGKLVDVERTTSEGWVRGVAVIEGSDDDRGHEMKIAFQNENLVAWVDGQAVLTVPDLICIVNREDGEPLTTELLRYGSRVAVVGIPCSPMLRTEEALAVVGPKAFGYDELEFTSLESIK